MTGKQVFYHLFLTVTVLLSQSACATDNRMYPGLQTMIWHDIWATDKPVQPGAHVSPGSELRQRVSAANLEHYRDLGARWNLVPVYQAHFDDNEIRRLHRVIKEHRINGVDVFFRLYEDPAIYSDLSTSPAPHSGYNADYYNWITRLATEFHSDVKFYLVGNEIDNDLRFNKIEDRDKKPFYVKDYDEYRKVLDTAYEAIKSVDPGLTVVDQGFSAQSLGLAVADSILRAGKPHEAHDFWKTFQNGRGIYASSFSRFLLMLANPNIRRKIDIVRTALTHPGKCDAYQLHYYNNWKSLPVALDWIRNTMQSAGTTRPILATEIGYLKPWKMTTGPDGKMKKVSIPGLFSEQDQAESMVKDFAILSSYGITAIEYWQMRFHHDQSIVARLYHAPQKPDDFIPTKAALAYKVFANSIGGLEPVANRLDIDGIYESGYSGSKDISIVWSGNGTAIPAGKLGDFARITDIYGRNVEFGADKPLVVTGEPLYIYWKTARDIPHA